MPNWLLDRLYSHQDQPTARFAFQGTINWMRALAILTSVPDLESSSIKQFYGEVHRRHPNPNGDTLAYEMLLMALHNLSSLNAFADRELNPYDVVRTAIVAWYYTIYYSTKAMIASASAADPQNHSSTARVWQSDIVEAGLVISPFSYFISSAVPNDIAEQISALRGANSYALNTKPENAEMAYGAVISYLKGTSEYVQGEVEKKVKTSKEYAVLGVKDFRTNAARAIRDKNLSKEKVNFLTQAFRYRGKANYRDSIYLSYGTDNSDKVSQFLQDLYAVASKFILMASVYISKRTERDSWANFVSDLAANGRFSGALDLSDI